MKNVKCCKGITLIALIITVIILLILAGTAISIAINGGDIFEKTSQAREGWNEAVENESSSLDEVYSYLASVTAIIKDDENNEEVVKLTRDNFKEYLGREVKNYTGAPSTVPGTEYTVSTTYRLLWIDFANKFGDGAGTIYLKADYPAGSNVLYKLKGTGNMATSKIRNLNPSLYANTPPDSSNRNMQTVTWLTDTSIWDGLRNGVNENIANKINYIVGGPSLEMLIDSYNTHYNRTETTPIAGNRNSNSERTTLFYKYTESDSGYQVGPSTASAFAIATAHYTLAADPKTIMYTSANALYWLASPSIFTDDTVMVVYGGNGGRIMVSNTTQAFCPLVSLAADAIIEL